MTAPDTGYTQASDKVGHFQDFHSTAMLKYPDFFPLIFMMFSSFP